MPGIGYYEGYKAVQCTNPQKVKVSFGGVAGGGGGGGGGVGGCCPQLVSKVCGQESVDPPLPPPPPTPAPIVGPTGDLGFTASNYGSALPLVFGSDKFTGNVFWTSPYEAKNYASPSGQLYTYYTVSFALGLCEGDLQSISRLWVGDKLVYSNRLDVDADNVVQPGADGTINGGYLDMTSSDSPLRGLASSDRQTKLTVFNGTETQVPSGIMVQEDGFTLTPAYRGLAYILFENYITTDETIPPIVAEVNSNSAAVSPRLYADFPTPQVLFDRFGDRLIIPDYGFGRVHLFAQDTTGSGDVPFGEGIATFSMTDLALESTYEIEQTVPVAGFNNVGMYPLSSGLVLLASAVNSALYTYQPYAGVIADTFGPTAGSQLDYDGFVSLLENAGCTFLSPTATQASTDVFFGVGTYTSVPDPDAAQGAFIEIDRHGRMQVAAIISDLIPENHTQSVCIPLVLPGEFIANNPTFVDATATQPRSVWVFYSSSATSTSELKIKRVNISNANTIEDYSVTSLTSIPHDDFTQAGSSFTIKHWMIDVSDYNFIIWGSSLGQDCIFKYSPFTGVIAWHVVPPQDNNFSMVNGQCENITGQDYYWVTNSNGISKLDVKTGVVINLGTLASQALPVNTGDAQCYDGRENALYYTSNTVGQRLVKVFVGRVSPGEVAVSTIVSSLLARVGLEASELDISDLAALSVLGYTVAQPSSLRTIFDDLRRIFRFDLVESNGKILYRTRGTASAVTIPHTDLSDIDTDGWIDELQDNQAGRPRKVNLTYRDFNREYEQNVQSFAFPKYSLSRFDDDYAIDVTVPVVLDADTARNLAEVLLYSKGTSENNYRIKLGPQYMYLDPGDVVTISNDTEPDMVIRIREMAIGDDKAIEVSAAKEDPDIYNDQADIFGNVGLFEPSRLATIDARVDAEILPITFRSDAEAAGADGAYLLFYTLLNVAGTALSNKPIQINVGTTPVINQAPFTRYPTWGYVTQALETRTSLYSTDDASVLKVRIISTTGASIASAASGAALIETAQINLAIVGGELIQYETVAVSGDVYTFTGIHRAKFGTENAAYNHRLGEKFILLGDATGTLDNVSIRRIALTRAGSRQAPASVTFESNNPFQPQVAFTFDGINQRPWRVVALTGAYNGGGDLVLDWQYQVRYDAAQWPDDGDFEVVTPTETGLAYTVAFYDPDTVDPIDNSVTVIYSDTAASNTYTFTAADQTAVSFNRATTRLVAIVVAYVVDTTQGSSVPAARLIDKDL